MKIIISYSQVSSYICVYSFMLKVTLVEVLIKAMVYFGKNPSEFVVVHNFGLEKKLTPNKWCNCLHVSIEMCKCIDWLVRMSHIVLMPLRLSWFCSNELGSLLCLYPNHGHSTSEILFLHMLFLGLHPNKRFYYGVPFLSWVHSAWAQFTCMTRSGRNSHEPLFKARSFKKIHF